MAAAVIKSRGRITIPPEVRQAMQLGTGDQIEFVEMEPGRYEVLATQRSVTALKGMFGKADKTVSIEDMNRTIRTVAAQVTSTR